MFIMSITVTDMFGSDDGKSHLAPVSFWTFCTLKCSEVL